MSSATQAAATVHDLRRVDGKAELIAGRIVHLMPSGHTPNRVAGRIYRSLDDHAEATGRGVAFTHNMGFVVPELSSGRQSFSPDVSYYLGPIPTDEMDFVEGPPTFAVEVRSKGDYDKAAETEMAAKCAELFRSGYEGRLGRRPQVQGDPGLPGSEAGSTDGSRPGTGSRREVGRAGMAHSGGPHLRMSSATCAGTGNRFGRRVGLVCSSRLCGCVLAHSAESAAISWRRRSRRPDPEHADGPDPAAHAPGDIVVRQAFHVAEEDDFAIELRKPLEDFRQPSLSLLAVEPRPHRRRRVGQGVAQPLRRFCQRPIERDFVRQIAPAHPRSGETRGPAPGPESCAARRQARHRIGRGTEATRGRPRGSSAARRRKGRTWLGSGSQPASGQAGAASRDTCAGRPADRWSQPGRARSRVVPPAGSSRQSGYRLA